MKTIGDRIKEILDIRGIQAKELADAIGVSEQAMSNYINNKRNINTDLAVNIANYLNVTTDYLLNNKNDSYKNEIEEVATLFEKLDDEEKQALLLMMRKLNTNK